MIKFVGSSRVLPPQVHQTELPNSTNNKLIIKSAVLITAVPQIPDDKPNTNNDVHYLCFIGLIEGNDS
jgi:hypothetical protein